MKRTILFTLALALLFSIVWPAVASADGGGSCWSNYLGRWVPHGFCGAYCCDNSRWVPKEQHRPAGSSPLPKPASTPIHSNPSYTNPGGSCYSATEGKWYAHGMRSKNGKGYYKCVSGRWIKFESHTPLLKDGEWARFIDFLRSPQLTEQDRRVGHFVTWRILWPLGLGLAADAGAAFVVLP